MSSFGRKGIIADHTISVHISNLRKKIKQYDPDEGYIQSVYGIGFRLEKS